MSICFIYRPQHKEVVYQEKLTESPYSKLISSQESFDKHIEKDYKLNAYYFLVEEIAKTKINNLSVINAMVQKKLPGSPKVTEAQLNYYRNKFASEKSKDQEVNKSNIKNESTDKNEECGDR